MEKMIVVALWDGVISFIGFGDTSFKVSISTLVWSWFDLSCPLGKRALHFSHQQHANRLCSSKVRTTVKIAIVLKEKNELSRIICDFYILCCSSYNTEGSSIRRARFPGSLVFIFLLFWSSNIYGFSSCHLHHLPTVKLKSTCCCLSMF